jgi:cyanophycinase
MDDEKRRPSGGAPATDRDAPPRGHLIAIGGAEDKTSDPRILARVMALAPPGNKTVAVIATASGVPEQVLPAYDAVFRRLQAAQVHLLDVRTREQAAAPEAIAAVRASGVIFFTGGDQLRLTHVLGGSELLEAIRQRFDAGAVVAGTSAGGVALSSTMIYDGSAADALRKGAVKMSSGLGFVEGVIIDSHFLERGRFTRLMEVGASNPEYLGVGLGEDAGVIFHSGGVLEALGRGHVVIVDSRELAGSNVAEIEDGAPVAVEHVVMHALIAGHGFDVEQRRYLGPQDLAGRLGERTDA